MARSFLISSLLFTLGATFFCSPMPSRAATAAHPAAEALVANDLDDDDAPLLTYQWQNPWYAAAERHQSGLIMVFLGGTTIVAYSRRSRRERKAQQLAYGARS